MSKKAMLLAFTLGVSAFPGAGISGTEVIDLSVSQHEAHPNKFSNAEIDALFVRMSKILTKADSASDVSCDVQFKRHGTVSEFAESEVPFSINSRRDFRKVNDKDVSVKVVGEINWCGRLGASIIGCASRPGSSMAVVRINGRTREAILWVHEYGHTTGSSHRDVARQVMRPSLRSTMREVNSTECNLVLSEMNLDPTGPMGLGEEDEVIAVESSTTEDAVVGDVEAFVSETFFEGVPYLQAVEFGAEVIPVLTEIIGDPERVEMWSNSVATLGAIGSEEAEEALMQFLFDRPVDELTATEYLAKSNVPVALGWLASRDDDGSAIETLISATNSDWWVNVARIDWTTPIHTDRQQLIQSLVTKSIIGLTLSGTEEAAIRLRQLEGQIDLGSPQPLLAPNESAVVDGLNEDAQEAITFVSPITREAIEANGGTEFIEAQEAERTVIQERGLLEYYRSDLN